MKKVFFLALIILVFLGNANASSFFNSEDVINNAFNLFVGPKVLTDPNNPGEKQYWFFTSLSPEFNIGPVSLGFDLRLQYNISDNKFYAEDWNTFSGIIRKIRFINYGKKYSKMFIRFGNLRGISITPGIFMTNYFNSPIVDKEKRGLEVDLDFGMFGFESMINDFSNPSIVGARLFFRPLIKAPIPIIKKAQLGFSYIGDLSAPSNVVYNTTYDTITATTSTEMEYDKKTLSTIAFDVNVPITKFNIFTTGVYTGYGKFINAGDGFIAGAYVYTLFDIKVNLEYRNISPDFIIDYFDNTYEVDRYDYLGTTKSKYDKLMYLAAQKKAGLSTDRSKGIFGGISGNIFNKIKISGSYEDLEGPDNGTLRINVDATKVIDKIKATLTYNRIMINHPRDLFTIDDRSFITGNLQYEITKFLLLSLDYKRIYRYNDVTSKYEPIESFKPNLLFSFKF